MDIQEERIAQLQELYMKQLGQAISKEEAAQQGEKLIRLVRILIQPQELYEHEHTDETN